MAAHRSLPEPRQDWEANAWLLTVIGDCCFRLKEYTAAYENLRRALFEGEDFGNAFLRLRRGQVLFELGELDRSAEELAAAFMLAGMEILDSEDPKYAAFLKSRLKPPANGEW